MKLNGPALALASALSLSSLSPNIQAQTEQVNVFVRNVFVESEGKKVAIVTSLPRNSTALNGAKCYKIIQQGEHLIYEIPPNKLPATSNFDIVDDDSILRFDQTQEKVKCPKV